ncbi:unnamed protein product, partial [Ixodes persulcatus]
LHFVAGLLWANAPLPSSTFSSRSCLGFRRCTFGNDACCSATLSSPLRCLATRTIVFLRDNVGNRGERVKQSHNSISNCTIVTPSALTVTGCTSWLQRWAPPASFTLWQKNGASLRTVVNGGFVIPPRVKERHPTSGV